MKVGNVVDRLHVSGKLRIARRTTFVGAIVTATLIPTIVAVASGPSGDPATIAYYEHAVTNTNNLRAYQIAETGYTRIFAALGKSGLISGWVWGTSQFTKGYFPSTEKVIFVQSAGKLVWFVDTLRPIVPPCHAQLCSSSYPIQFFASKSGAFEGVVYPHSIVSCYHRVLPKNLPFTIGRSYWSVFGKFLPMIVQGSQTLVTSTFTLAQRNYTETDSIDSMSKLFTKSIVKVSPGLGLPGFTYHQSDTVLSAIPAVPRITLCK